jgi:hypothetical protein
VFNGIDQSDAVSSWSFLLVDKFLHSLLLRLPVEIHVPELELKLAGRAKCSENDVPTSWRPEYTVAGFLIERLEEDEVAFAWVKLIEVDGRLDGIPNELARKGRVVARNQSKAVAFRLPSKGGDSVFDLNDLDGDGLFSDSEDFEVAVSGLLRLGETVNLDAEVVAVVLPMELALKR